MESVSSWTWRSILNTQSSSKSSKSGDFMGVVSYVFCCNPQQMRGNENRGRVLLYLGLRFTTLSIAVLYKIWSRI